MARKCMRELLVVDVVVVVVVLIIPNGIRSAS